MSNEAYIVQLPFGPVELLPQAGLNMQETITAFFCDIYKGYARIQTQGQALVIDEFRLMPESLLKSRALGHQFAKKNLIILP